MKLKRLRQAKKLTRYALAKAAGISQVFRAPARGWALRSHRGDVNDTRQGPRGAGDGAPRVMAVDREQLRRECADALETLLREQSVTEIPRLSDAGALAQRTARTVSWCGRCCMTEPTTRSPGT